MANASAAARIKSTTSGTGQNGESTQRRDTLVATTFRLSRHLEIELISTTTTCFHQNNHDDNNNNNGSNNKQDGTTALEYWNDGRLRSIGFFNFTGRLVFHHHHRETVDEDDQGSDLPAIATKDDGLDRGNSSKKAVVVHNKPSLVSPTTDCSSKSNHGPHSSNGVDAADNVYKDDHDESDSVFDRCGTSSSAFSLPSLDRSNIEKPIKPVVSPPTLPPLLTMASKDAANQVRQHHQQKTQNKDSEHDGDVQDENNDYRTVFSQTPHHFDLAACQTTEYERPQDHSNSQSSHAAAGALSSQPPLVQQKEEHQDAEATKLSIPVKPALEYPPGEVAEMLSGCSDQEEEDAFDHLDSGQCTRFIPNIRPPRRATLVKSSIRGTPRLYRNVGVLRKVWTFAHPQSQKTGGRRTIPKHICSKRHNNLRSGSLQSAGSTPLHKLCAMPQATLEELIECANRYPKAISTLDSLGRYPLHILADNEVLILSSLVSLPSSGQRDAASIFCGHLINEFPQATITPDHDGFVPFARILSDWIEWACDVPNQQRDLQEDEGQPSELLNDENGSDMTNDYSGNLKRNQSGINGRGFKKSYYSTRKGIFMGGRHNSFGAPGSVDNDDDAATAKTNHYWHLTSFDRTVFPRVEVWEEVEWCLVMLSNVLDVLSHHSSVHNANANNKLNQNSLPAKRRQTVTSSMTDETSPSNDSAQQASPALEHMKARGSMDDRKVLAEALVEKLPNLVPTVLLVDDDGMNTRERLLEMQIIRRLLICHQTVGMWLIEMLNHGGSPAKRAVDYLWLVSGVSIEDYTGSYGSVHSTELEAFNTDRQNVFEAVGSLKGTIASLVTLDTKEIERAASTPVIWRTMNQKLSRPFVLGLVLIDLLLHLTLMVAFRPIATPKAELSELGVLSSTVIFVILAHYLLRKSCEAWVLLSVSPLAVRAYFSNMWTVFDSFAIILTLWATIWHHLAGNDIYRTGLNTLVAGVLWIKVLGFLKVVNKEMSTFILALSQILYDIRLFMVVLVVCVIMFGDMFFIAVSTKEDGQYCLNLEKDAETETADDFCTSAFDSYLRVYSLLLGDFSLDAMTETAATTVLFIIFTVFGVIIMLNVLIAIISDSYEKATLSGGLLFGRARVLYVAQNEALERFLQPRRREGSIFANVPIVGESCLRSKARQAPRCVVLLAIVVAAIQALLFLIGLLVIYAINDLWISFATTLCMVLLLSCALWVVGTFVLDGVLRDLLPQRAKRVYDAIGGINNWIVSRISNFLFGLDKEKIISMGSNGILEDDWNGRVKYLESVLERMIAETRVELKSEIMEMRTEVHEIHEHVTSN
ncbi:hypothetical protein ACA910_022737 [Epithemia clementina (nom. ined.)]